MNLNGDCFRYDRLQFSKSPITQLDVDCQLGAIIPEAKICSVSIFGFHSQGITMTVKFRKIKRRNSQKYYENRRANREIKPHIKKYGFDDISEIMSCADIAHNFNINMSKGPAYRLSRLTTVRHKLDNYRQTWFDGPFIDFGYISDKKARTPHISDSIDWKKLNDDASVLQQKNELNLPYEDCAFIYRSTVAELVQKQYINLVMMKTLTTGIHGIIFGRIFGESPPHDHWMLLPVEFFLEFGRDDIQLTPNGDISSADWAITMAGAQATAEDVRATLMILDQRGPTIEVESTQNLDAKTRKYNRATKSRQAPIVKVIRIVKPNHAPTASSAPVPGFSKAPHNRRGHYRRYRSGKKVWVRPAEIKGGSGSKMFRAEV